MADTTNASKRLLRRKHSSVDLQQTVLHFEVYKRPLGNSIGPTVVPLGVCHEGGIATTTNGTLYLIEKGEALNDDINYQIRYREDKCRIVQVTHRDIRDWKLVRSVEKVNPGTTLEDLFDACGSNYGFLADNCWNGTQRMRAAANKVEDGLAWQEKAVIGVGVAFGIGALLIGALSSGDKKKKKEEDHMHKY